MESEGIEINQQKLEYKGRYIRNIKLMYLVEYLGNIWFLNPVMVIFMTDWGGLSYFETMSLQAWSTFWIMILEIPSGAFADYIGRKRTIIAARIILCFAIVTYSIVPNIGLFIFSEILWAISGALYSGSSEALVYDTLVVLDREEDSRKVLGRLNSAMLLGIVTGCLLSSVIVKYLGLVHTMRLMLIPVTISLLMASFLREPKNQEMSNEHLGKTFKDYLSILKEAKNLVKSSRLIRNLILDNVIINTISYYNIWLWQKRLQSIGVDIEWFALISILYLATQIVVLNNYGKLENLLKSKTPLIRLGAILTGIGFIMTAVTDSLIVILIGTVIIAGFGQTRRTLMTSYLNEVIPSSSRATMISIMSMVRSISLAGVSPLVGKFADNYLKYVLLTLGLSALVWSSQNNYNDAENKNLM